MDDYVKTQIDAYDSIIIKYYKYILFLSQFTSLIRSQSLSVSPSLKQQYAESSERLAPYSFTLDFQGTWWTKCFKQHLQRTQDKIMLCIS